MIGMRSKPVPAADGAKAAAVVRREVLRYREGAEASSAEDDLSVEEPLEIRLHGEPIAVLMRTPGDDFDLVAGFLLTEKVIERPRDLGALSFCETGEPPNAENVVDVRLADGVEFDSERLRRNFYSSSSCGVCGKASIDQIRLECPSIDGDFCVDLEALFALDAGLRRSQAVFHRTGSLHAAALFDARGDLLVTREDVGRHNAVDKVVGSYVLAAQRPPTPSILMVSGRSSFEIIQKAAMAAIPMVVAVSAPSSMAVDLAREVGITLVGFLRGRGCNVYSGSDRIRGS